MTATDDVEHRQFAFFNIQFSICNRVPGKPCHPTPPAPPCEEGEQSSARLACVKEGGPGIPPAPPPIGNGLQQVDYPFGEALVAEDDIQLRVRSHLFEDFQLAQPH